MTSDLPPEADEKTEKIRTLARAGFNKTVIAEMTGMSLSTVKRRARKAGDIFFAEHRGRDNHARARSQKLRSLVAERYGLDENSREFVNDLIKALDEIMNPTRP